MASARRQAYLQALGLDPLVLRVSPENDMCLRPESAAASESCAPGLQSLHLGPGDGSILLVCNNPAEAATRLATDIARSLDSEPVWSWPMPAETGRLSSKLLVAFYYPCADIWRTGRARTVVIVIWARN
jgi:hypothetical protein